MFLRGNLPRRVSLRICDVFGHFARSRAEARFDCVFTWFLALRTKNLHFSRAVQQGHSDAYVSHLGVSGPLAEGIILVFFAGFLYFLGAPRVQKGRFDAPASRGWAAWLFFAVIYARFGALVFNAICRTSVQ